MMPPHRQSAPLVESSSCHQVARQTQMSQPESAVEMSSRQLDLGSRVRG